MPENFERPLSLSFSFAERSPAPVRKPVSSVRNSASVLSFRKQSPLEPEDARITGATRSLYRRLLALNLRQPVSGRAEETYLPPLTA
jgi:hypothetical protein